MWRQLQRDRMSAGLTWRPCPEDGCAAKRGEWCDQSAAPWAEMILIERDPARMVHASRMIEAAAKDPRVPRARLIAQFGDGALPAGLAA